MGSRFVDSVIASFALDGFRRVVDDSKDEFL